MPLESLLEETLGLFVAGGWVLVVIGLMSVGGLAVILIKIWQFRATRIGSRSFVEPALADWRCGRVEVAMSRLAGQPNPIARLLEVIVAPPPDLDRTRLVDEVERLARQELVKLRSHLKVLDVIATLSPLLGLLGTVLGMIEAFRELQIGAGEPDPALLAGGISTALLTTAGGLIVAIPASAALNAFESAIESLHDAMEDAVTRALHMRLPAMARSESEDVDAKAPHI